MSIRLVAILLTLAIVVPAVGPLMPAAATPTYDGDVVINGAFHDARAEGHPLKYYGPALWENETEPSTTEYPFVAYDWTAPVGVVDRISLPESGGLRIAPAASGSSSGTPFVQQHFNGTNGQHRPMDVAGISIRASAESGTTSIRVDVRGSGIPGANTQVSRTISLSTTTTTTFFSDADLGLPSGAFKLGSVRVWIAGANPAVIERVQVFATNGIEARNVFIGAGADDIVARTPAATVQGPGPDGKYTFFMKLVDDRGDGFPVEGGVLCIYPFEGYPNDGFSTSGGTCPSAILDSAQSQAYRTVLPDGVRFDIPASALPPTGAAPAGFVVWGALEIDATSGGLYSNPETFVSGWMNAAQAALVDARTGAATTILSDMPTPVFFDRDSNGVADGVQTDGLDGHAVITRPQNVVGAAQSPVTVMSRDVNGDYVFDVEVNQYRLTSGTGGPIELRADASGFVFTLFDGEAIANNPSGFWKSQPTLWASTASDVTVLDADTYRVRVPASAVTDATTGSNLVGAWAWYDIAGGEWNGVIGAGDSASDFYSSLQTAASGLAVADALRGHATPILLAPPTGLKTDGPTMLLRVGAGDSAAAVPGGLAIADLDADGALTFEYAVVLADRSIYAPSGGFTTRALAVYDAAGAISDAFDPLANEMEHAEHVASGTLTSDGWFRVDVPLSALNNVKGPIAVWAHADDGAGIARDSWFSVAKIAAATASTGAAEAMSDLITPLVITETNGNIPTALLNTLQGLTGLASVRNPVINPGFELDLLVEGTKEHNDGLSGTMTAPPWFLRLDDNGTSQPTNPRSTHEVKTGGARWGDNALLIKYDPRDAGKGLMLGQMFSPDDGPQAYVWRNATSVTFESTVTGLSGYWMSAVIRYKDDAGNIRMSEASTHIPNDGWRKTTLTFAQKIEGQLLGVYLLPSASSRTWIYIDNVVVNGAELVAGEARSDLNDGYAMIIEPWGLARDTAPVQGIVKGVAGDFLLYNVSAMDYSSGTATVVDTSLVTSHAFALRTQERETANGELLRLKGEAGRMVGVVALGNVPAQAAAPWAFLDVGEVYYTLNQHDFPEQPVSGYYSPVKNALRATSLADHLDYAATPVTFDTERVAANFSGGKQQVRFVPVASGFGVHVATDSPFVETVTVELARPGAPVQTHTVTVSSAAGDQVPGLVIAADVLETTTVTTHDTRFTRGVVLAGGSPAASFDVCKLVNETCLTTGIITLENIEFRSTTTVPSGEAVTLVWDFGDGSTPVTTTDPVVSKSYRRPGPYTVNLTATTPSGRTGSFEGQVLIGNRAPNVTGFLAPSTIHVDTPVTLTARATDVDGTSLTFAWTLENMTVDGVNANKLTLTPERLLLHTGLETLTKRAYQVSLVATDDQGAQSDVFTDFVVVKDRKTNVGLPIVTPLAAANATYALVGEPIRVASFVTDLDNNVTAAKAVFETGGVATDVPLTLANATLGLWNTDTNTLTAGAYNVTLVATDDEGRSTTSIALPFEVRENAAPVAQVEGPAIMQAFETATFTANASDPDARGALVHEWLVDGDFVHAGPNFTYEPMGQSGVHVITLRVTDANGGVTEADHEVGVDDVLLLDVSVVADDFWGDITVTARVTNETGDAVEGALVVFEDFFGGLPSLPQSGSAYTDDEGYATWSVPRVGPLNLPGEHRLVVTAAQQSRPGAVVDDVEDVTRELTYEVRLLP